MRAMLRTALLALTASVALAAEVAPAAAHAADLIQARAQHLRGVDDAGATRLLRLADDVRNGRVSLADAEAVLRIASALPAAPVAPARAAAPAPAPMSPQHATALLDGVAPPVPPAPRPPVASAAATTPAAPLPPTANAATTVPSAPPASAPLNPDPAATPPPRIRSTVLAVERGSDAQAALVAIDAGAKEGVKEGDRFAIQRKGATRVLARASKVSEDMTIALIIPGTWTDGQAEIADGDEAVSVDDR